MPNIIDSIRMSGTTYAISDSGGTKVVEITQSDYDNLPTSAKTANIMYVITDAEPFDVSNYYTKSETSGATELATAFAATQPKLSAGTNITIDANNVISATGGGGGGDVTTNTDQNITGTKTFVGEKKIKFKQSSNSDKIGFTLLNSASTNNELASFELRPNTFTIDEVQHPLLYFGHYRTTVTANARVPQTVIGFRQYDQKNAAAYHYLIPLPEKAKTPFSLTTSFKDYYAPIGFKNGSTMITADNTGVVDLSSEFSGKVDTSTYNTLSGTVTAHTADTTIHVTSSDKSSWNGAVIDIATVSGQVSTNTTNIATVSAATASNTTALGGLKLVKLSQAQYDALSPNYDSNTLYVIVN